MPLYANKECFVTIADECRGSFREHVERRLRYFPDALTADKAAEIVGYSRTTILRYARKKYIYAVAILGKYYISKKSVISYLSTDRAFKNTQKSEWHENVIMRLHTIK